MLKVARKIMDDAKLEEQAIREETAAKLALLREENKKIIDEHKADNELITTERYTRELNKLKNEYNFNLNTDILNAKKNILSGVLQEITAGIINDRDLYKKYLLKTIVRAYPESHIEIIILGEHSDIADLTFTQELGTLLKAINEKDITVSIEKPHNEASPPAGTGVIVKTGKIQYNGILEDAVQTIADTYILEVTKILFKE